MGYAILSIHHPNSSNAVLYPPLTVKLTKLYFSYLFSTSVSELLPADAGPSRLCISGAWRRSFCRVIAQYLHCVEYEVELLYTSLSDLTHRLRKTWVTKTGKSGELTGRGRREEWRQWVEYWQNPGPRCQSGSENSTCIICRIIAVCLLFKEILLLFKRQFILSAF